MELTNEYIIALAVMVLSTIIKWTTTTSTIIYIICELIIIAYIGYFYGLIPAFLAIAMSNLNYKIGIFIGGEERAIKILKQRLEAYKNAQKHNNKN